MRDTETKLNSGILNSSIENVQNGMDTIMSLVHLSAPAIGWPHQAYIAGINPTSPTAHELLRGLDDIWA